MTKRKTKAQREAEQLEALGQRIEDIYSGAAGRCIDDNLDAICVEELSRALPALEAQLGEPTRNWYGWRSYNLEHFATIKGAAEFLFRHGFRADRYLSPED